MPYNFATQNVIPVCNTSYDILKDMIVGLVFWGLAQTLGEDKTHPART